MGDDHALSFRIIVIFIILVKQKNDLFSSDPTSKVPGNDCSLLDALGFYHDKVIIFNLIRAAVLTKIETKMAL